MRATLTGDPWEKSNDLTAGDRSEVTVAVALEAAERGFPAVAIADFRQEVRLPVAMVDTCLQKT